MAKISVMGTGSWGTALAILLHNNGHQVMLWSAHPEKAASLNQTREDQQTTFPIDSTGTDYCKCGERCRRKYAYACV